jgi:hypothetical protein
MWKVDLAPIYRTFLAAHSRIKRDMRHREVDPLSFYHIAGTTTSYLISRILFGTTRARHNKIHRHMKCIFKTGISIQPAVPAAKRIPFEDFHTFRKTYRRQCHEVKWHLAPQFKALSSSASQYSANLP